MKPTSSNVRHYVTFENLGDKTKKKEKSFYISLLKHMCQLKVLGLSF